jgi:hypothetical protein
MGYVLLPLHRGYAGLKLWQGFRVDKEADASSAARFAANETKALEGEHHLVYGRRGDRKEALHIGLGGRPSNDERVGMDEGQVLALLARESLACGAHASVD